MQDHLKERLTGAAILVIVVVSLVPEMFRGRSTADIDRDRLEHVGGAFEGPPVRSYTIDLREGVTAQPPAANIPPASAPPPAVAVPLAPADRTGSEATAAATSSPAPAAASSTATEPAKPASKAKTGWTVQVGSFARREFAERMLKQVRAKGFAVEVAGPDDRGLYRVRSIPTQNRAAAQELRRKMVARGLKPIVNTAP